MSSDDSSSSPLAVASGQPDAAAPPSDTATSSALGTYHPGLDGMRGIAMLLILAAHGGLPWTRGGFLGLSQFFTLSGFLIMGVLLRNHLHPGRSMRSFWGRRARRLMPAAFLAMAGIVVFGATVATRQQAENLPGQIVAAATWTANWHFIATDQSYLDAFAEPSPVQHFWSLAIEEQFYIILPIVFLLIIARTRSPFVLAGVLGGAALVSTAWMAVLYQGGASLDRLYYGTDTRVAELLTGAVLAVVLLHTGLDFSERMRRIFATVGMVAFGITIWSFINVPLADGPIWRGGFFLFSLVSCALILGVLAHRGPLVPLLSWWPLTATGRISYGLYLYHFPIYLWLTETRTGLSQWPLLTLRVSLTFTVAILSYHFVERPILRGASFRIPGRARFALVPVAVIALIVAAFVIVTPSADDPLETLRAGASPAAMPREAGDGVLDLLVIPGRADDRVIQRLEEQTKDDDAVNLFVAEPFRCVGGLVDTPDGRTCANWARSWPELIEQHDPDAVLLYADDWAGEDLGQLTGRPPEEEAEAAGEILSAGFDLLTARGAPVVWAKTGENYADAYRRSFLPFNRAMAQLRTQRNDLFDVRAAPNPAKLSDEEYLSRSTAILLADTSLYQRTKDLGLPRVMIVGDSQALSLGYGLDRWAAENERALVWNRGLEGCGAVVEGRLRTFGSTDSGADRCREAVRAWSDQVRSFQPDIVVMLSSITDIQERQLPGSSQFRSIGDPEFDTFLVEEYTQAVDTLSTTGAQVLWMTAPCIGSQSAAAQVSGYDTSQIDYLNSVILPELELERPGGVVSFDLDDVICSGGEPLETVDGVKDIRPDGVHFSVDGALWFADKYGDELLELGGL